MSKPSHPAVSLWPRAEPFTYGIFQVHPHPRLAVHNIKKLVSYAKSKGKAGFPKLSYPIWKHVACNKLQLTEDLAWILFHTCLTMSTWHMEKLKDVEERLFTSGNTTDCGCVLLLLFILFAERIKSTQSIDLFVFALFLYIQQINKISLRASAVSANAEWPSSHNRSSELDSGRSTPIRPCRNLDEQYHLQFVTENLTEMLDLLVEPEGYGSAGLDAFLSEEAMDALNLIFEGTVDQGRSLNSFSDLIRMPAIQPATGYSKLNRNYHLRGLHSWIRSWLASNPFSVENCIRNGRRLQWRLPYQAASKNVPTSGSTEGQQSSQSEMSKRQKIATNAHQVPRSGGRNGNKLVIMSMISRQIIARSSATLDGATLKIHRAHCSYLYLLSPMRSVTLDKCRKLTIVLGPIENTLQLNHCEDCLIVSACRRAVLVSCRRCTLHLSIQSRPILIQPPLPTVSTTGTTSPSVLGQPTQTSTGTTTSGAGTVTQLSNEEILLAPFHTTYLRLLDHLARASLSTMVNYWDQPFLLGQEPNPNDPSPPGKGRCWELLRPAHFYPFNIPLLIPAKLENLDPATRPNDSVQPGDTPLRFPINSLDLSAILITDTYRFFVNSGDSDAEDYTEMVNNRLPIPLPAPYIAALRERASVYHKWPQHIANARLTPEQRQLFGTLVDQRFRQWLSESGSLRQLQLLELSTGGQSTNSQAGNADGNSIEVVGVPPAGAHPTRQNNNTANTERAARSGSSGTGRITGGFVRGDRSRSTTLQDSQMLNEA
ncbi:hypothetical protein P879_03639 [Paragonimus westermani]|uniref:C-CAP/cofactor C-like domain-containing protein n=1 Tax=Paragonimus westermani TaxID=34504 RepID=A0A8T0DFZ7_9TREM|nr:hypothetical protein P879_03639 [Paragonimus westermani]